ncbi:hypothetical protein [Pectobacterium parvum]|uniref:Asparagine synthase n=1 Tax=Pectobacterium parvum TaxID=2778550 RepID=A0AAP9LD79_9GAMM|nr:hypothetical protein [Pectobacterium parvum]QHQ25093.1 hypothetical protein GMX10_14200 [Pectobacterium parvum]
MANFIFVNKEKNEIPLSEYLIKKEIEGLSDLDVEYFENDKYILCFSYTNEDVFFRKNDGITFIAGVGVYDDQVISKGNVFDVLKEIEFKGEYNRLSGRYVVFNICDDRADIITSVFSSFPHYIYNDNAIHCSSTYLLKRLIKGSINENALVERCLYYCNYNKTLLNNVKWVHPSCHYIYHDNEIKIVSYLRDVIKLYDEVDRNTAIKLIAKRLEYLTTLYSNRFDNISISLSGGRDSRFLLCQLLRVCDKEKIEVYTVGESSDIEYRVANKFTKIFGLKHSLFSPAKLNESELNNYTRKFENINFPVQYKNEFSNYLSDKKPNVINTAIPETLLCHLGYFNGNAHPAINFLYNRSSTMNSATFVSGYEISLETEIAAIEYWEFLKSELPNNTSVKLFFELTSFQRDWVYKILRPFDYSGNTICIMEDPLILSILSSLPEKWLEDDAFYDDLIKSEYSEAYVIPTTRQFSAKGLLASFPSCVMKNYSLFFSSLFSVSSLGYLTKRNSEFIVSYINNNSDVVKGYFTDDEIKIFLFKINKYKYTQNRVIRFLKSKFAPSINIKEYDLIIPLCLISILKNYKKN